MTDALKLEDRLQQFLDIEAIRALRILYCDVLDTGRVEGFHDVFTDDATISVSVGTMVGIEAIKAGNAGAFDHYNWKKKASHPFMHAVTNHKITLTGPDTAEGQCYLLDFVTGREADTHPILLLGIYIDKYVRVGGKWKISGSRLDVKWGSQDA